MESRSQRSQAAMSEVVREERQELLMRHQFITTYGDTAMKVFYGSLTCFLQPASKLRSVTRMLKESQRRAGKIFVALVVTGSFVAASPAMAQSVVLGTANGGYLSFAVGANSTSSAITLPVNIPWHVTAGVTTYQDQGVAEIEAIATADGAAPILEWVGLNSPGSGAVTSGLSTSGTATIAKIDFLGDVVLSTSTTTNSFWVTNNSAETQTGYITWTGFGTALTEPSNTALGVNALSAAVNSPSSAGSYNTATGYGALLSTSGGSDNTANGAFTMQYNSAGNANSAFGYAALYFTAGSNNTGTGYAALYTNGTGANNTATGFEALYTNSTGSYNSASGYQALLENTTGQQNNAAGVYALRDNTTGSYNTATGVDALYRNTTGSSNIAEGYKAGFNLTTGSNNIDIGSPGVAADGAVIRIGTITGTTSTQTATYIAGIYDVTSVSGGLPVVIDSKGQLGTTSSSARFKTAIAPLGPESAKLQQLRPVSFRYKADPHGGRRYGLIAEEVAQVYPELVVRTEEGRIDGVRYEELAPLLLNEVQQQQKQMATQAETIAAQNERLASQEAQLRDLKRQERALTSRVSELNNMQTQMDAMRAALLRLQANEDFIAAR